jgi:phospholipase C
MAITNVANAEAEVILLDAYTGKEISQHLKRQQALEDELPLDQFSGWYDLIVKVSGDPSFKYQIAGHVETGKDSISDPALGGLVRLRH